MWNIAVSVMKAVGVAVAADLVVRATLWGAKKKLKADEKPPMAVRKAKA